MNDIFYTLFIIIGISFSIISYTSNRYYGWSAAVVHGIVAFFIWPCMLLNVLVNSHAETWDSPSVQRMEKSKANLRCWQDKVSKALNKTIKNLTIERKIYNQKMKIMSRLETLQADALWEEITLNVRVLRSSGEVNNNLYQKVRRMKKRYNQLTGRNLSLEVRFM